MTRKAYVILPCGHAALLPKRWTVAVCPTCGVRFEDANAAPDATADIRMDGVEMMPVINT